MVSSPTVQYFLHLRQTAPARRAPLDPTVHPRRGCLSALLPDVADCAVLGTLHQKTPQPPFPLLRALLSVSNLALKAAMFAAILTFKEEAPKCLLLAS